MTEQIGSEQPKLKTPELFNTPEIKIEKGSLILIVGSPASGKSTFVNTYFPQSTIVATDEIRRELTNNAGNQNMSAPAFAQARRTVETRMKNGQTTVIDAMNLNAENRRGFTMLAKEYNNPTIAIHLDISVETALKRDKERNKQVGDELIKNKLKNKSAIKAMHRESLIGSIYTIDETMQEAGVNVELSESDKEKFESEKDFFAVANNAEENIFKFLGKHKEKLANESLPRVEIQPSSANFIKDTLEVRQFLENNTVPGQVIDLDFFIQRLASDEQDEVTQKAISTLLYHRNNHNLVTFVLYSNKTKDLAEKIKDYNQDKLKNSNELTIPKDEASNAVIEIAGNEKSDEPLLILGDIHGSFMAMRDILTQNREEEKQNLDQPKRKVVFVGDVADRGQYSAYTTVKAAQMVKNSEADWILGNHDINLRNGLTEVLSEFDKQGIDWEEFIKTFKVDDLKPIVKSKATRKSISDLLSFIDKVKKGSMKKTGERPRFSENTVREILEVLNEAPVYKEWKHIVAVHGSLPFIPMEGEEIDPKLEKKFTHGISAHNGPVRQTLKIRTSVAKDPYKLAVAGHTHDDGVAEDQLSGSIGLDDGGPTLHGLKYPEMTYLSSEEPYLAELTKLMKEPDLPTGDKLWELVDFLQNQLMIKTNTAKKGTEFEGLTVVSYHETTETQNLWEKYPILRNFRGLIIDKEGNIVARPFKKTHKAGIEIPLNELEIVPEKVFEKANGFMGVCYFWKDKWRIATKFSFQSESFTEPAQNLLDELDTSNLDPKNTYLFEVVIPEDEHIIDYHGKSQLILLNSNQNETGKAVDWDKLEETAKDLGCRTAEDLTDKFKGKTIAEIYKYAQTEGNLKEYEGLMAITTDPDTGEKITTKIKVLEYDNKKFVRDRLRWSNIFKSYDWRKLNIDPENKEKLLSYNADNLFIVNALEVRLQWIRDESNNLISNFNKKYGEIIKDAKDLYHEYSQDMTDDKKGKKDVLEETLKLVSAKLGTDRPKQEKGAVLSIIRSMIQNQNIDISSYAETVIVKTIEEESKKRPKNSYWLTP